MFRTAKTLKTFAVVLAIALLSLAFAMQAEARPHLPAKAAHGAKHLGGKLLHGGGKALHRAAHPFNGKGVPDLRRLRG